MRNNLGFGFWTRIQLGTLSPPCVVVMDVVVDVVVDVGPFAKVNET